MHRFTAETAEMAKRIIDYALERVRMDPPELDGPRPYDELAAAAGETVTAQGMGADAALQLWVDVLAPACVSTDHPRYLAFIPTAPSEAAVLFDLVVGASSIYAGSWLEGAGAVYAENQALDWLAGLAGMPEGAGGCFVPGGTTGNLSALATARNAVRAQRDASKPLPRRWAIVATEEAHSSIRSSARVMDVDVIGVPADGRGRLLGASVRSALDALDPETAGGVFAVVATAGITNLGVIDDLAGVAQVCAERGIWFHVDAAYGGAALCAPTVRERFTGIERADSFIVDPHKWLFAPFDCCALLYRNPAQARAAHTQRASYLETMVARAEWNPSDYAHHLSRRARGLPFWFSLATHGTDAYTAAVEGTLATTRLAAEEIERRPYLELLLEPELSVLVYRRAGWKAADYVHWADEMLESQVAFCMPTTFQDDTCARLCIVNPRTTLDDVAVALDAMA